MKMELRFIESELRVNQDGTMVVSGYVNKTNQLSEVLGHGKRFREKILPGCFERAIANASRDIDFLPEHDDDKILSSTRNGSLTLREDDQGLFMEATITPTTYGKDTYELIRAGILRNMSFGMRVLKDHWKMIESNLFERTVEELDLIEVSVVRDPAYTQSTIAARGIDVIEDADIPSEILEEAKQMDELMKALSALEERMGAFESELKEIRAEREKSEEEKRALKEEQEKAEAERLAEEEKAKAEAEEKARLEAEALEAKKAEEEAEKLRLEEEAAVATAKLAELKNQLALLRQ